MSTQTDAYIHKHIPLGEGLKNAMQRTHRTPRVQPDAYWTRLHCRCSGPSSPQIDQQLSRTVDKQKVISKHGFRQSAESNITYGIQVYCMVIGAPQYRTNSSPSGALLVYV
jgi:hypothetical protein